MLKRKAKMLNNLERCLHRYRTTRGQLQLMTVLNRRLHKNYRVKAQAHNWQCKWSKRRKNSLQDTRSKNTTKTNSTLSNLQKIKQLFRCQANVADLLKTRKERTNPLSKIKAGRERKTRRIRRTRGLRREHN